MADKFKYPWVITSIGAGLFGISAEVVKTMVVVSDFSVIPQSPPYVRGVINLRGKILTLVDMRLRFKMRSYLEEIEEFCNLMIQRENDHKEWLVKLEQSVKDRGEITVQTDPHKCSFGKWYDTFRTENIVLNGILKKFDGPHKRIHGIAAEADNFIKTGKHEQAQALIEICRNSDLAEMLRLFADVRRHIKAGKREIVIVVESKSGDFALVVDSVESVENLKEDSIESMNAVNYKSLDKRSIPSMGRREKTDQFVLLLEVNEILKEDDFCSSLTQAKDNPGVKAE